MNVWTPSCIHFCQSSLTRHLKGWLTPMSSGCSLQVKSLCALLHNAPSVSSSPCLGLTGVSYNGSVSQAVWGRGRECWPPVMPPCCGLYNSAVYRTFTSLKMRFCAGYRCMWVISVCGVYAWKYGNCNSSSLYRGQSSWQTCHIKIQHCDRISDATEQNTKS